MAVQVPGECSREFIALVYSEDQGWQFVDDFLASIVWRDHGDFHDETLQWLRLVPQLQQRYSVEDTLLAVTTEPGHPYNADFLHKNLMRYQLPDRDAFWSTYLALSYQESSHELDQPTTPAREIVDWAWNAEKEHVEDERLRLCAIVLSWMLSTSQRELRDQATKALVSVFIDRPALALHLLRHFSKVDDPYVSERLYAAAYGAALNHRDRQVVASLAEAAFDMIFATGEPPPHLLLRDYARGLIELAEYLGVRPHSVILAAVRPPYQSAWPLKIPTIEEIDIGNGPADAIAYSVFQHDFNRYTMKSLQRWSTTPLDEEGLRTNRSAYEAFLCRLHERGNSDELAAFYSVCPPAAEEASEAYVHNEIRRQLESMDVEKLRILHKQLKEKQSHEREMMLREYMKKMPLCENQTFEENIVPYLKDSDFDQYPKYALRFLYDDAARWIYHTAISMGWIKEKFGEFEKTFCRFSAGDRPILERIGKKYQYIALHELHARLSDHLKLLDSWARVDVVTYEGPWQLGTRDVDPSLLIDRTKEPGWASARLPVWWCPYEAELGAELSTDELQDWLWSPCDFPRFESILMVHSSNRRFCVLNTFWSVRQRERRKTDVGLPVRELWARVQAAIVHRSDVGVLTAHIREASRDRARARSGESDLRDGTVFRPEESGSDFFLGEWPWHPSADRLSEDWTPATEQPDLWGSPVAMVLPAVQYVRESGTEDKSLKGRIDVWIPSKWLLRSLRLRLTDGRNLAFSAGGNRMVFCDPSVARDGPSAALVDTEALAGLLEQEGLALVWAVSGEKNVYQPLFYGRHCFSGLYHWDGACTDVSGRLWMWEDRPEGGPTKLG